MATVSQRQSETESDGASVLESALTAVARRLRLARWVRHASRGALAAVAVSLVAALLDHFDLLPDWLPLYAFIEGAFVLGLASGTATAYLKPIPSMAVARYAETRLGLKERLSSALEFEQNSGLSDDPEALVFRRLQRQDAREYAQKLKAADAAPLVLSWEAKALLPALIVLALALILPDLPLFVPPGVLTERGIVRKEGGKLDQAAKIIEKQADAQNLPTTRHAARTMQQLARRMAQGRMDKKQAMVRISQLTQQMQAQQRQLAQQSGQAASGGGKSLSQAGQQLAASLQNPPPGSRNGQGTNKSQGATTAGPKANSAQVAHTGGAHGFNAPGQAKPGDKSAQNPPGSQNGAQTTPEMRQAAQAMQQNDAATLSRQLRQLAQKTENGQLSPTRQQQAAQDLQKLAQSLQGAGMPQTQQHAQAASQALAQGDKATAAQEMRKAADAADREAQQKADAQGMQNAQNSLQNGQGEMAGAQNPGDIPDAPPGQGQGNKPGTAPGQGRQPGSAGTIPADGRPGNGGHGGGRGKPNTAYHQGQKPKGRLVQQPGVGKDAPHWLDPHLDPAKNPRYAKLYFGKPQTAGPSGPGPDRKTRPGDAGGPVHSAVPYYNTVVSARKTAETAMDREDIPPAYKKNVADYFNSLQPQTVPPAATGRGGASPR